MNKLVALVSSLPLMAVAMEAPAHAEDAQVSCLWIEMSATDGWAPYEALANYVKNSGTTPFSFNRIVIRINDPGQYPLAGSIPAPGSTDQPGLLIRFLENLEEAPAWEGQIALLPYFGSSQTNPTWEWESTINPAVYWRKPMLWAHLANEYLYSQKSSRSLYFNEVNLENEAMAIPHGTNWVDVFCDLRCFGACFDGSSPTPRLSYTPGFTGTGSIVTWTSDSQECSPFPGHSTDTCPYTGAHLDFGYIEMYGMYKSVTDGNGAYLKTLVDAIALDKCCYPSGGSCLSYCPQPACYAECGATPPPCGTAPVGASVSPSIYSLALPNAGSAPDCVPSNGSGIDQILGTPQLATPVSNFGFLYGSHADISVVSGADLSKVCLMFSCASASNQKGLIDAFGLWDGTKGLGVNDFKNFVSTFDESFGQWWTSSAQPPGTTAPSSMPVYGIFQYHHLPDSWKATGGCPSDYNSDGVVDGSDVGLLLAGWGGEDHDINGDGTSDSGDLGLVLAAWGSCPGP